MTSENVQCERLRRMRDTWRQDTPSAFEIATAVGRLEARRREPRGHTSLGAGLIWGATGLLLGLAATLLISPSQSGRRATSIQPENVAVTADTANVPEPANTPRATDPAPRVTPRAPALRAPAASVAPSAEPSVAPSAEPSAEQSSSSASRWIAVGRGSDAGPIVVGLPPRSSSQREARTRPTPSAAQYR